MTYHQPNVKAKAKRGGNKRRHKFLMMMYDIEVMIEEVVWLKCLFTSICNSPVCWHATSLKPQRKSPVFENHNLRRGRGVLSNSRLVVAFTNTRQNKDEKGGINDERITVRKESQIKKHAWADWQRQRSGLLCWQKRKKWVRLTGR